MSIRARLSLFYTSLLAVSLLAFGVALYTLMATHLYRLADEDLEQQANHYVSLIAAGVFDAGLVETPTIPEEPPAFLFDERGTLIWRHGQFAPPPLQMLIASKGGGGDRWFVTEATPTDRRRHYVIRLAARPDAGAGTPGYLVVTRSYQQSETLLRRLRDLLLLGGLAVIVAAAWLGWRLAAGALRPIAGITETARLIAASRSFDRQLRVDNQAQDEVGRLAMTFNEMLASLRQAYERERQFVADASHELRAPLTTLLGNLDLLLRAWDRLPLEDRRAILADLQGETLRMKRLVEELLTLARADAGEGLQRQPVELDRIALEVFRSFRTQAREHVLRVEAFEPVLVKGDPDLLRGMAVELVDNALRYTPAGGSVTLSLTTRGGEALFSVTDTGMGIEAEALPFIFDRFYRADRARSRQSGGTGLGLSIVRRIVEQHGGRVEVESQVGVGSRFTVYLPLLQEGQEDGARRRAASLEQPVTA